MLPGELKPILTALVLPPGGPLLLLLGAAVLALLRRRAMAWLLASTAAAGLWLLSSHGFAVWLAGALLPPVPPLAPLQLDVHLKVRQVQAIVILGGGVEPFAPEYGTPQPSAATLERLRFGAHLARASGVPVAFAGGKGWGASTAQTGSEAAVAQDVLREWGLTLRWQDGESRDTGENARQMQAVLGRDGVTRIALVTHAWHMPRSLRHFEAAGFTVLPAPTGYIVGTRSDLLEWLPGSAGLQASRTVLREWLALQLMR